METADSAAAPRASHNHLLQKDKGVWPTSWFKHIAFIAALFCLFTFLLLFCCSAKKYYFKPIANLHWTSSVQLDLLKVLILMSFCKWWPPWSVAKPFVNNAIFTIKGLNYWHQTHLLWSHLCSFWALQPISSLTNLVPDCWCSSCSQTELI